MDVARDELFELIEKTEDKQQKAQLLVMLKMYDAIVENTKITKVAAKDIEDQKTTFKNHVDEEMKMVAKGQGMYRTSMFFLGIIQLILAAVIGSFYQDWKLMKHGIESNITTVEVLKEQIRRIESRIEILHKK